jgi:hypothetical protein
MRRYNLRGQVHDLLFHPGGLRLIRGSIRIQRSRVYHLIYG